MKYINNCMRSIKPYLKRGQGLSLESTTYPGTCRKIILPYLKKFDVGNNFFFGLLSRKRRPWQ